MNQDEKSAEVVKASEEVQRRNIEAILHRVDKMEKEYKEQIRLLNHQLQILASQFNNLQEKYNLLLTKNFRGGSTTE